VIGPGLRRKILGQIELSSQDVLLSILHGLDDGHCGGRWVGEYISLPERQDSPSGVSEPCSLAPIALPVSCDLRRPIRRVGPAFERTPQTLPVPSMPEVTIAEHTDTSPPKNEVRPPEDLLRLNRWPDSSLSNSGAQKAFRHAALLRVGAHYQRSGWRCRPESSERGHNNQTALTGPTQVRVRPQGPQ